MFVKDKFLQTRRLIEITKFHKNDTKFNLWLLQIVKIDDRCRYCGLQCTAPISSSSVNISTIVQNTNSLPSLCYFRSNNFFYRRNRTIFSCSDIVLRLWWWWATTGNIVRVKEHYWQWHRHFVWFTKGTC